MKASLSVTILPCLAAAYFLGACDDSTGPGAPRDPSVTKALLTAVKWKPAARTVSPGFDVDEDGRLDYDLFALEDACGHDDIQTFKADGTWQGDEGADKCDPADPQIATGTWALNDAGDSLNIGNDAEPGQVLGKIVALSASKLSISASGNDWPDGKTRTETFTWSAAK